MIVGGQGLLLLALIPFVLALRQRRGGGARWIVSGDRDNGAPTRAIWLLVLVASALGRSRSRGVSGTIGEPAALRRLRRVAGLRCA